MQVVSPFNGLNVDYRIIALIIGAIISFQVFIETTEYNVEQIYLEYLINRLAY